MTDWEFCWDMVGYVRSIAGIAASGVLLVLFVRPFLAQRRHMAVIGAAYTAGILLCKFCPYAMSSMTAHAFGAGAALLVMYKIDRRNIRQKLFLAVTYWILDAIAWRIILLPWSVLYERLLMTPDMARRPYLSFCLFILMELLLTVMDCLVIGLLVRIIQRTYHSKNADMTGRELLMTLAPALPAAMGYLMTAFFYDAYVTAAGPGIRDYQRVYNGVMAVYMGVSFAAMITAVIFYQQLRGQQEREKEEAMLSRQMEDMRQHIDGLDRLYFDIRSLKHDMRNHVMVLERLYGENAETGEYLAKLRSRVDDALEDIKSGHPVTDVILWEKHREAVQKGIDFSYDFRYPQGTAVDAFDISIILSNAVNNAMEAAWGCREPYIRITSSRRKNAYLIEVKNRMEGMRQMDSESGLPVTTKKDGGHGFGLVNIRKVAQRYYGDIDIRQKEGEFALCVMLMLECP